MVAGTTIGVFLTFVGIYMAYVLPTGLGSDAGAAVRAVFPAAALIRRTADAAAVVSGFAQFPVYGAVVGFGISKGRRSTLGALAVVALLHLAAFGLACKR